MTYEKPKTAHVVQKLLKWTNNLEWHTKKRAEGKLFTLTGRSRVPLFDCLQIEFNELM